VSGGVAKWLKGAARELLIAALIFTLASAAVSALRRPALESEALPPWELPLLDGGHFSAMTPRERPLVVYIWGTWCPVCVAQSPVIDELARSGRADVLTIASRSGDAAALRAWLLERGYSFPVYSDPQGALSGALGVSAYPTTLIYDRGGRLRSVVVGYTFGVALWARLLWVEGG
jgi:thiol-disulfide isomerase/thioredoxin